MLREMDLAMSLPPRMQAVWRYVPGSSPAVPAVVSGSASGAVPVSVSGAAPAAALYGAGFGFSRILTKMYQKA